MFVRRLNVAAVWLLALLIAALMAKFAVFGQDAHAYWLAGRREDMYGAGPEEADAYLYSPVFAQVVGPVALLPWPVFWGLWTALEVAALAWLVQPLGWRWRVPVVLACLPELYIGNIFLLLAVVAALGVRHAAPWLFGLLTKVSTGVGFLWFGVRREWRTLARALGVLAFVVWVSVGADPGAWVEWFRFLRSHSDGLDVFTFGRWVAAVAVVVWGAWTWRPWTLAVGMLLALPLVNAWACFTVLTALPRLLESETVAVDRRGLDDLAVSR